MNTDDLKNAAENLQGKAQEFLNKPQVQDAINKGKEYVDKGMDWLENGQGKEYVHKGKEMLESAKDKLEDFVEDKTGGKGILGFGAKED